MALDEAKFSEEYYDDTPSRTWNTSFNVDGTLYATNLFWQPLQNADDPYSDVEQAAQNILEGADLFCITKGKAPQFGICISSEGYEKSQNVAAACVASSLADVSSVVGVFKVDQGWWYVCIRNDIILSDGDMLFTNEEDAKAQFASMMAVPDWDKKYAPAEWGLDGSEEADFSMLLARGDNVKLQKIKSLRGGKLAAVFAISGFLSLWILYSLIDAIFLTPTVRPVVTVAPKKVVPIAKTVETPKLPAPWENLPLANEFMKRCYGASLEFASVLPPGWAMGSVLCENNSAKTVWRKNVGKVSWMKKALDDAKVGFSGVAYSDSGNETVAFLLFGKQILKSSPPRLSESDLIFELNDVFQSFGIKISLARKSFKDKSESVYKMVSFSFVSQQNPMSWISVLTKYSGLLFDNIGYDPVGKLWKYEGVIYVL